MNNRIRLLHTIDQRSLRNGNSYSTRIRRSRRWLHQHLFLFVCKKRMLPTLLDHLFLASGPEGGFNNIHRAHIE